MSGDPVAAAFDGIRRIADERRVMAHALRDASQRAVFDFLDAVERDVGVEAARRLSEIRDRELQREQNEQRAREEA